MGGGSPHGRRVRRRPRRSSLWTVETIVAGAVEDGCTPAQAVGVFRSIWYYTVGEILVRARSARREAPVGQGFLERVDSSQLPTLAALGDQWPILAAQDTYLDGLRAFVDGLLNQATATAG